MTLFIIGTLFGIACSVVVYIFTDSMIKCIKANEQEKRRKEKKKKEELTSLIRTTVNECLVASKDNENN